jgi:hypothetical protein
MLTAVTKKKSAEYFARAGIVAKGVVYCLIGLLTSLTAVGIRQQKMDQTDTFKLIHEQPFGKILLVIIATGLFGYVMWRSFQAIQDIDHKGKNSKAIFIRIGYAISAAIYLGLGVYALKLALQGSSTDNGDAQKTMISKVLEYPTGGWIVGLLAVIITVNGVSQIYKGISQRFMENVNFYNGDRAGLYKKAGIIGYISRGMVLIIIAYFFVKAALHKNANEVEGTKGAFDFLEDNFGTALMGIVALGLLAYGVFMFIKGRYQRIDINL